MTHDHCEKDDGCFEAEHARHYRAPTGLALLPWLLLGMAAFSNLFQGQTSNPWLGGLGLLTFNSLYIYVTFRAFVKGCCSPRTRG